MQYEICLEMANKLEAIKKLHLQDSAAVKTLADLIHKNGILDLTYLNKVAESLLAVGSGGKEEPSFELSPVSLLRTEILSEDLAPWVRSLRKRLFGKTEAPFADYNSAVEWMKQYDIQATMVTSKVSPNTMVGTESFRRNVRYYEPNGDDWGNVVLARINSPLEKIIFACQKLTKQLEIGLDWNSVVFYVLADVPPFIPPAEVDVISFYKTLPSGRVIKYYEANVKLRQDFNVSSLRWAYESVRKLMKLTRKKEFKVTHLELYRLVQQKGGAPHGKGTVAFWMSVMNEWNESHPKHKYGTWKGVKIAYERILSRLSPTETDNHIIFGPNTKKEGNHERTHNKEG